jgi:SOS response regulatory protein OraA/RecX
MKTLIELQDAYIATVNAGEARWSHRPDGGHARRVRRGAARKLHDALARRGYTAEQISAAIRDASDVAKLERYSEE